MTRQTRRTERESGSWRPGDAQLGWIIENRIDEAYVLSWPGQLETWVPVHDTGGYDRARAPVGSYDFRLDQIKGTASLRSGNQVHLSFDTPALHPRANLNFTFVYFDLAARNGRSSLEGTELGPRPHLHSRSRSPRFALDILRQPVGPGARSCLEIPDSDTRSGWL